jgi:hypothetical protein
VFDPIDEEEIERQRSILGEGGEPSDSFSIANPPYCFVAWGSTGFTQFGLDILSQPVYQH